MPTPKPTPEEKLFAVIQGAAQPPLRPRARTTTLAMVGARLTAWAGPMDLPRVNRILAWVIVAILGACALSLFALRPETDRVVANAQRQASPFTIAAPLEGLQPSDVYVKTMIGQDPFHVGVEPTAATTTTPPPAQAAAVQSVLADLKLVGISWGDTPVAMIEQITTKQTYFVKPGEPIGPAKVKGILRDRVILDIGGKEIELY